MISKKIIIRWINKNSFLWPSVYKRRSDFYDVVRFPEYATETTEMQDAARPRALCGSDAGTVNARRGSDAGETRVDAVPSYFLA